MAAISLNPSSPDMFEDEPETSKRTSRVFSEMNLNEEPQKKLKAAFSCPALGCAVEFQKEGQCNAHWKKIHESKMVVF